MKRFIPYIKRIKQKRSWVIISACILGCFYLYQATTELPTYTTSITFVLNKEFTLPPKFLERKLTSRRRKRINKRQQQNYCQQVIIYATSMALMRKTLFKKIEMDGQIDFLANHIIESYGIFKKENLTNPKLKPLINFKFKNAAIDSFDKKEMKAFKRVNGLIKNEKNELLSAIFDKNRQVIIMSVTSLHPNLPAIILNAIYEDLAAYYYNKEFGYVHDQQRILTNKQIEYSKELDELIPTLGNEINKSGTYPARTSQLPEKRLNQLLKKLNTDKSKIDRLLAQSDLALLEVTPIFEVYQSPNAYPNPKYSFNSWWIEILKGISIGTTLAILAIIIHKAIQNFIRLIKED